MTITREEVFETAETAEAVETAEASKDDKESKGSEYLGNLAQVLCIRYPVTF